MKVESTSYFNVEATPDFNIATMSDFNIATTSDFNVEATPDFNIDATAIVYHKERSNIVTHCHIIYFITNIYITISHSLCTGEGIQVPTPGNVVELRYA
jgi:hypothetical protein